MYSKCQVCGQPRSTRKHSKCSRKLQEMYAPGTELHAQREAEKQGELKAKVAWVDVPVGKKTAYHIRMDKNWS